MAVVKSVLENLNPIQMTPSCSRRFNSAVGTPTGGVILDAVLTCFSTTRLEVSVAADQIINNSVCVVRVVQANSTFDEYSAIGVTNPAENITDSSVFEPMTTARRNPGVGIPSDPRSRYLFAMGGDGGEGQPLNDSIEVGALDEFGTVSPWRQLRQRLPEPRTNFSTVVQGGEFVYIMGGRVDDGAGGLELTNFQSCAHRFYARRTACFGAAEIDLVEEGLGTGLWYHKVSAIMDANHPLNPGGETLPSERPPVLFHLRSSRTSWLLCLRWEPVPGATSYRIYRTANPDERVSGLFTLPQSMAWRPHGAMMG